MRTLVVICHPLESSLCRAIARRVTDVLEEAGHNVVVENLYDAQFPAALTESERASYYSSEYRSADVQAQIARLQVAEALVLVFPTWWFSFPAMLKGWFDRVWAPGAAFHHAADLGRIRPGLTQLRHALAITTLGAPAWIDRFILWRPVRRVLRWALFKTCAPQCEFSMLSLYEAEKVSPERFESFVRRAETIVRKWPATVIR
ncbi:NAD(P)H-dependent oxidoreductase [Tahibacter amnicola]|uniref:NAD(P)H-dependent oxidoreductase n=1 Tax=Tahibacter amnicola TaxID=2976241 RepID=A0ABY6B8N7_9GAMM|nr:NAD(P)H-dependent oxidoreductase [Tahibacter amnicola]UXI66443.1 NAD(P)H-dependent oxidoreductase [Tahibacter amnicola]